MTPFPILPRGLWFDEFKPGQSFETPGRTISEADIVNFAGLSGDINPIHMDAEFARTTEFGQRVAHGLLVVSIASGLLMRTGVLDGTIGAFREIVKWKFRKPVFIGDTIRVILEILETKPLKGNSSGLVTMGLGVKNQDDVLVMSGKLAVLVLGKPDNNKGTD